MSFAGLPNLSGLQGLLGLTQPTTGMFGATPDAGSMFRPPSLMNLVRDPNNPNKAKIVWGAPQQPGQTPSPATNPNPFTMTGGGVPTPSTATPNPAPLSPVQPDWTKLIDLITSLTNKPQGTPQPVTVTPGVDLPQTLNQSPTPLTAPSTTTDIPGSGGADTAKSKQETDTQTIDEPTPAQIAAMNLSNLAPDISSAGKVPGLYTGGPLTVPAPDLTGLVANSGRQGTTETVDNPTPEQIAGMTGSAAPSVGGGNITTGLTPVTVTPSASQDFGTGSSAKAGSSGGLNVNDLINAAIGVGGMAAPPGVGALAGLLKGGIQGYNGDTYNTNGLSTAQSLAYGPGMGERAGSWLAQQFGGGTPQLPASAGLDPTAQIGNQGATGVLTSGLFSGGPAVVPNSMFDPSLMAGNLSGAGAGSGGWMFPSLNFSTMQMGGLPLDLSGLSNFMQGGKLPMSG